MRSGRKEVSELTNPIEVDGIPEFFVVFFTTRFTSLAEVQRETPDLLAEHVQSSKRLHDQGRLLMAGAFVDRPDEPLRTMGVARTYEDAKDYAEHDPFLRAGYVEEWHIRRWSNIFG
jgi:uncharacterized protein YciI